MDKQLCFIIEGRELYLDQVLEKFNDIPIFFICKSEEQYYLALCTDIEILKYIVIETTKDKLYNMLNGLISIKYVFLSSEDFFEIITDRKPDSDIVLKRKNQELNQELLPKGNFKIFFKDILEYTKKLN